MKNRQGSTLVLVLMIFVVLSILATGTMGIMMSENKQSIYQKNKIQAYYIARSGAEATEAAIMEICKEYDDKVDSIEKNEELNEMQKEFEKSNITPKKEDIGTINKIVQPPKINFANKGEIVEITLEREGESLTIKSTGKVGTSIETVKKEIVEKQFKHQGHELKFDYGVYASEELNIQGVKNIKGNMATKKLTGNYGGEVKILKEGEIIKYPLYTFAETPKVPTLNEVKKINGIQQVSSISELKNLIENKKATKFYYNGNLEIKDNITIQNNEKVTLYVLGNINIENIKSLELNGYANIFVSENIIIKDVGELKFTGNKEIYVQNEVLIESDKDSKYKLTDGKVNLHILKNFKMYGDYDITSNNFNDLNIYNYGNETIIGNPGDKIDLNANIYNLNNTIKIEVGQFHYKGNIISNGNEIIINQNGQNFQHKVGSVYAPNSTIIIKQGSPYKIDNGVIIGRIVKIEQGVDLDIKSNKNISLPIDKIDSIQLENEYQSYYK